MIVVKAFKKILLFNNKYVVVLLLVIFFIIEAYSKHILIIEGDPSSITKIIKAFIFFFFFFTLLRNKKSVFWIGILTLIFVIGQYYLQNSFTKDAILNFSRHIFPLLLLFFFKKLKFKRSLILLNVFEILLIVNAFFILLGFFFKIPLAETYTYGLRFGYNGFFINSTTGSYVCLIGLIHFSLRYKEQLFRQLHFYFFLTSLFLIGTKVVYLSIIMVLLFHLYQFNRLKYKKYLLILFLSFGALAFFIAFFKTGIFNEIRQDKGLLSAIFSYRNELLFNDTIPYIKDNWTLINYLFGGVEDFNLRSEFGFIDVFFFFGIVGGIVYLYLFYKAFTVFELNKINSIILLYMSFVIFVAGNFFSYATLPIYILILRESIIINSKKKI